MSHLALSAEWAAPILQVVWIRSQRVETAWQRTIGVETASRHQDKQTLAAAVSALEADDDDRAEMLAVADLMEGLRAAR